jgi:ABC-type bacteriocin/lantibiotic exporter with double-glycine peptidase domain
MKTKNNLGIGNGFSAWCGERLLKIPMPLICIIALMFMGMDGYLISKYNDLISKIVSTGVSNTLFSLLIIYNVGLLVTNRGKMISMKSFSMRKLNMDYASISQRCINSKVSAINEVTTGKITDTSRTLCMLKWNNISYWFNIIPSIIPFMALLIKEWGYNPIMSVITFVGVFISALILIFNEKLFGWSKAASEKKAELESVTVDNFMNLTTFKFIHETLFPIKRLIKAQNESFKYTVNISRMLVFGICLACMWSPTLINVWIGRKSIEMVAYIFMTDYIIHNVSSQISDIVDNLIEIKAKEKIISELKGDDTIERKLLEDDIDLSGCEFKHVKTIRETKYQKEGIKETLFSVKSFLLRKNDRYLIKGKSGEGKSSFLAWLAGMLITTKGECPNIKTYYVWQETSLYNDTLINNIIPDVVDENEYAEKLERINYYADRLDMRELIDSLPEGWNTYCGERGYLLSSGQKQRVNIIRTLMAMHYHPEYVFLLDEITSNLDTKTRKLAIKLIDEECKSTLIVVSHNSGFESIVDHNVKVNNHTVIMNDSTTRERVIQVS